MQMTSSVRELRVAVDLAVRVFGMDSTGKPFSDPARVVEISGEGAKLKDILRLLRIDDVIGLQFGTEKSRFREVWIGERNTAEQGCVEIHCMARDKCLWSGAVPQQSAVAATGRADLELQPEAATQRPAAVNSKGAKAGAERRRYPRYPCYGTVLMSRPGGNPNTLKLLDMSLGGFYAETMSPFVVGTTATLEISAQSFSVRGEGMVRTSHPSVGNGVAFTKMDEQNWRQLSELVASLSGPVSKADEVQPQIDAAIDALVQLLETRGVLTPAEFLQQLQQAKKH